MNKTKITSIIVLAAAVVMHLTGVILVGVRDMMTTFDIVPLANSLRDLGLIAAILSGIVLIALVIIGAAKSTFEKDDSDKGKK